MGQAVLGAAIEVPPGDAVHREDDAGVGADQRHHRRRGIRQDRGFQRDEDDVLDPQRVRPVGDADPGAMALGADPQGDPALGDGGELGAARHRRDLDPRGGCTGPEPRRDMTADRKPIADAEVRVFAPGEPGRPVLTGRTDGTGKFEFSANTDGLWSAEARGGGEIARVTVRVGSTEESEPLSPFWVVGGLLLMLILAVGYRVARARSRRSPPNRPGSPPRMS